MVIHVEITIEEWTHWMESFSNVEKGVGVSHDAERDSIKCYFRFLARWNLDLDSSGVLLEGSLVVSSKVVVDDVSMDVLGSSGVEMGFFAFVLR